MSQKLCYGSGRMLPKLIEKVTMMNEQDKATKLNRFLIRLVQMVGYVGLAFLANLMVSEYFGGVNPLVEYSYGSFSKLETPESKNEAGLGLAYQACKDNLSRNQVSYEFPDQSYQAWNLTGGRYLIESRIYTSANPGAAVAGNLLCKVLKTEDSEYLAVHWTVQGTQVN